MLPLTFVDPEFFHLSFLSVVTVAFLLYGIFREKLSASRFLVWTGGLSMFIYIVHGDLRWLIIPIVNETQNVWFAYVAFFGFMTDVCVTNGVTVGGSVFTGVFVGVGLITGFL